MKTEENGRPLEPQDLIVPEDFKNCWADAVTDEQYHADKSAVGSSSIALMLQSPRAFYQGHFKGKMKPESNDMRLGKIIHMALLEPDRFESSYVVMPEFWGYTNDGKRTNNANCKDVKDKKAAWLADRPPGQVIVTEEEMEQLRGMIESVNSHPQGPGVFSKGKTEVVGYYRDPRTGIKCKIKPDFLGDDFWMITDFKTCVSSDTMLFGSKAFGLRYDLRIWMYSYGVEQITGVRPEQQFFMACEKSWPYEAAVYFLTDEQRNQAQYDYNRAMDRLLACIESNHWPMRQTKMEPLYTPKRFIDRDVFEHEKELDDAGN